MRQQVNQQANAASQDGFALLTVLIIVALVATLSSQLLYQQHLSVSRSAHMLHQAQSLSVAWGLEDWVKRGLELDAKNNQNDHLQELWSQPLVSVPFAGGDISGQLYDLQGRINLNNVQASEQQQRERWQQLIDRWVTRIGLETPLSEVLTDWVDLDQEPLPGGAESDSYLLMQPPYRAANQPLVMLEELNQLQGFQKIAYEPWLAIKASASTLPSVTPINVNTASKVVLMSLTDWMNESVVDSWIELRKQTPAAETAEFRRFMQQQTGQTPELLADALPDWLISIRSDYFLLQGQINYGDAQQGVSAIFYRPANSPVKLVQRWLSVPQN